MEKKTKLWLGAGLVAVAGYLLWKSKQANTTPAVASTAKPSVATTATGTSNLVGFNHSKFFKPDTKKLATGGESAAAMQVPASKQFYKVEDGKFNVEGKWANMANVPFKQTPHNIVSKKVMPFTATDGPVMKHFTTTDGPVMKHYNGGLVSAKMKNLTDGVQSGNEYHNASGNKFFDPRTAKYGQNQGVFAPAPKTTVMPKEVKQAAPTKMIVGVDASNKTSMNFLANQKIWA
jgi:hypothetical protein